MQKQSDLVKRIRAIVALVLVAMYAAGLVAMLASKVALASILWVVSTLGGIGLLYWLHILKKREEGAEKANENARPEDR